MTAGLADGSEQTWTTHYPDEAPWRVRVESPDGSAVSAEGDDLFRALQQVRRSLERREILLYCNGARADVRPSPSASAAGAELVCLLPRNRPVCTLDLVPLFARAPAGSVVSVERQEEHWRRIGSSRLRKLWPLNPAWWWKKARETLHGHRHWISEVDASGFTEWRAVTRRRRSPPVWRDSVDTRNQRRGEGCPR